MPQIQFIAELLKLSCLPVIAVSLVAGASASATVMSTFDIDGEAWTTFADAENLTYSAAGGNPGGAVRAEDVGNGQIWYWQAPAKFLGDQSGAWGGSLSFDLIQGSLSRQLNEDDVILIGGGLTIVFDTASNPELTWTDYSIDFTDTAGWTLNTTGGSVASAAQIQTVLGSLDTLRIRGEYVNGTPTTTHCLIMSSSPPSPPRWLCLAWGLWRCTIVGVVSRLTPSRQ